MEINWKKNTALFLTGQAISFFGTMVVQYAIVWYITLKSQSGSMMTLFTAAGFLPMFFISPFAGVWADRFNRKYIINIADGSIAFFSLITAFFLLWGFDNYIILLLCALVRSAGQGVQTPAVGTFIPQIVPAEHLTKINGFQNSIQSLATLTAPALSGALMTFAPLEIIFFLDVITAGIGISIVFFLVKTPSAPSAPASAAAPSAPSAAAAAANTAEPSAAGTPASAPSSAAAPRGNTGAAYFHDLKEGIRYIKNHTFILRMMLLSGIFLFMVAPCAFLTPLQVTRNFGGDVWRLSAVEIIFSAGMTAGGILIGIWGGFKNRIYTMALSYISCGILTLGLGLVSHFVPYLILMALIGVSLPLYNTPSMVLLQTAIAPAFMGRVIAVFSMISSTMMPLGMIFFGPVSDVIPIDTLLVVTGILMAALSAPLIASKTLRAAGLSRRLP